MIQLYTLLAFFYTIFSRSVLEDVKNCRSTVNIGSKVSSKIYNPKSSIAHVFFAEDIAPFLYKNCTSCHRPGQVAPFSLVTYDDARKHAKEIVALTQNRQMPPWKPKPGYVKYLGDRRLSEREIRMVSQWVEEGMQPGEKKDLPTPPKFVDSWQLGTPDLVIYMPEVLTIPPDGPDIFRVFIIPLDFPKDKHIRAMDIMPSNRKVLHHTTIYLDTDAVSRQMAEKYEGASPEFGPPGMYIGGWAPGGVAMPYPNGYARRLPKTSDLILESHFRPSGKVETERTAIGLYFSEKSNLKEPGDVLLKNYEIDLPPNEISHVKIDEVIDSDLSIFGIAGHAHLVCSEIKAHAILPNKKDVPLLWISDWDFNWQEQYRFQKPIILPKGTRILADFTYDNTEKNFRNPNIPPKRVKAGGLSSDEMATLMINTLPK